MDNNKTHLNSYRERLTEFKEYTQRQTTVMIENILHKGMDLDLDLKDAAPILSLSVEVLSLAVDKAIADHKEKGLL